MSKGKKITIAVVAAIVVLLTAVTVYFLTFSYKPLDSVHVALEDQDGINVIEEDGFIAFEPDACEGIGFVFYPGASVEPEAYAPLMRKIADNGVYCVIVKEPCNLAFFNSDAADEFLELKGNSISSWYVGGHSLGGWVASSYVADNIANYDGLILLAAYSTEDISDSGLGVLSIYGENDEVLSSNTYSNNRDNLPDDMEEIVIPGGNHAYFGVYGEQRGDGEATITNDEQIVFTSEAILRFVKK
ncbi:MAG: alpha/beta hydrolase [Clostridia bacterium]|nr:alpha/beta hydrolase [Clostridia bacterium]